MKLGKWPTPSTGLPAPALKDRRRQLQISYWRYGVGVVEAAAKTDGSVLFIDSVVGC